MVAAPGAAALSGEAKPPLGQRSRYAWLDPGSCACSPWLVPVTCHRIDVRGGAFVRAGSIFTKGLEDPLTRRYTFPMTRDSSKPRRRVIAAADRPFCGQSIRTVGVDAVAEAAGVTERT